MSLEYMVQLASVLPIVQQALPKSEYQIDNAIKNLSPSFIT